MEPNHVVNQAPMQSAPVVPKDSIVQDDNAKKGGKGAIIGMVIFAILALGGIGFGVWTWMDGNTQKDALNNQISDLKKQNGELLDKMAEAGGGSDVNTEDYIYLGDWGIKLKIGGELELFNLTHYGGENGDTYAMTVIYSDQVGVVSDLYGAAIDNGDSFPIVFITRSKESIYNVWDSDLEPVYNDGEYNYFVYRSSGAVLVNMGNEADRIVEAAGDMTEILNNTANYSVI